MQRHFSEIAENEDQVKLFEPKLDTLKGCDLDIRECNDKEWWIGQVNEALCGWLKADISSGWNTFKG